MPSIRWFDNFHVEEAISVAREEGQPLLVDFWHPTCSGCAKLFATTYQSPQLIDLLASRFVCIKYQTNAANDWFRKLNGRFAHLWHPDIVVMDANLFETRRFIGYLPPGDFAAQILIGAGLVHLYHSRAAEAVPVFEQATTVDPAATAVPEALYWAGVAAYRAGDGLAALTPYWEQLAARFPGSDWAKRADCLDVEIPETGFLMSDLGSVKLKPAPQPAWCEIS